MATPDQTLEGMKVILEPLFVESRHLRTWRERLWSWTPWVKYRTVPSKKIIQYDDNTLIMHPQTWEEAKKFIKERNEATKSSN